MGEMLSEHFSRYEFEHSDTAISLHINNTMDSKCLSNAKHTCTYLLEPLRKLFTEKYGKVIIQITSGYRCLKLNEKLKSKNTSQHVQALASDFYVYKFVNNKKIQIPVEEVYNDVKIWVKSGKLVVDQCILEVVKSTGKKWVHCSLTPQIKDARKQFLKYNGKTYSLDIDIA